MRILFISSPNLMATDLARRMSEDGNEVKLYIDDKDRENSFDGIVEKTTDWKSELDWVKKDGLIVFDDVGYGSIQDQLRNDGYLVVGGSYLGDRLETDRVYAQEILSEYELKTVPTMNFDRADEAISFLEKTPGPWVLKQNGDASKGFNFVSSESKNGDIINLLEVYEETKYHSGAAITLQKKIVGYEIGVGRYFNGKNWVGPIELNIEHKKMFPDELGPSTSEMGTLAWYESDENLPIYKDTLHKLTPYLRKINFRGDLEINFIVNRDGIWPLEVTPRFGSPAVYLQTEIFDVPWADFLMAVAKGEHLEIEYKKGFGLVLVLATPPFPYMKKSPDFTSRGQMVFFDNLDPEDLEHIHFEGVAKNTKGNFFYIADDQGYVAYVTSVDMDIASAKEKVYSLAQKIRVPKLFYRNDIPSRWALNNLEQVKKLGYL